MYLEDQITSVELSIRLKELKIKQESYFVWKFLPVPEKYMAFQKLDESEENISAFTSDELFELLPSFIDIKKDYPFNFFNFNLIKRHAQNIQFIINYHCDTFHSDELNNKGSFFPKTFMDNIHDEKLADCLAKTLIYLIENKIIEIKSHES